MDQLVKNNFDRSQKIYQKYNKNILCVDLQNSGFIPNIYSQGKVPSCVVNSFVYALKFKLNQMANRIINYCPSRYYLYYYACFNNSFKGKIYKILNLVKNNNGNGSCISYLLNAINSNGMILELPWENNNDLQLINCMKKPIPLDLSNETLNDNQIELIKNGQYIFQNNNDSCLGIDNKYILNHDIWKHKIDIQYLSIFNNCTNRFKYYLQNHDMIMICIAINIKQMILYGYSKYENMISSMPYIIKKIKKTKKKSNNENYHSMVIIGYNDLYRAFKLANSWGNNWGYDGYCWISYDYFNKDVILSATIIKNIKI